MHQEIYLGKVAKFSDAELLYGAGIYQIYEDSGRKISTAIKNTPRLFNNYGDNNGDPEQIMMGINLYKNKNKNGGGAW